MTLGPMGLCYLTWFAALRRLPPAATAALGTLIGPSSASSPRRCCSASRSACARSSPLPLTLGGVTLALRRS